MPTRIPMPNSEVVFSSNATTETTTYTGGQWVTTVPVGYSGNVFLGGVAYQVPAGVDLAGATADWQGVLSGTTVSFTLAWQWAAASYSSLGTAATFGSSAFYDALGIKPVDAGTTAYPNTDAAGTPENFKSGFLSSATTGAGPAGTNYQYVGQYNQPGNAYYQAYLLNE